MTSFISNVQLRTPANVLLLSMAARSDTSRDNYSYTKESRFHD